METLFRICGAAMISLIALVLMRTARQEFVFPLRLTVTAVIFGAAFTLIAPVIGYLQTLSDGLGMPEKTAVLFRALGAAFLTQICAGICRENGEATLASGVEFAGRGTVLVLCLPLMQSVLSLAEDLLQ